jgi:hypothetical protein
MPTTMDPDDREFMRELLLRHEKATDSMIRRLDAGTDEMRTRTDLLVRRIDAGTKRLNELTEQFVVQMEASRREFVDETRAQRAALFRILDRLDEGGSAASA